MAFPEPAAAPVLQESEWGHKENRVGTLPEAGPVPEAGRGTCRAAVDQAAALMLPETHEPDETNALFMVEVARAVARGVDALEFIAQHLHERER